MTPIPATQTNDLRPASGWGSVWPWVFLVAFIFMTSAGAVLQSAQAVPPSGYLDVLSRIGMVFLLWYWLKDQCRPYRASFALDMGMFIAVFGVLLVPFYLWRYERWRGVAKLAVLLTAYIAAYLFSAVCMAILFALVGDTEP
jgi:hypothetical protein